MVQPIMSTPPIQPDGVVIFKPVVINDPEREYVLVQGYTSVQQRVLSSTIDDIEREIDLEMYDRMSNDSIITKCKKIIITNALTDDLELAPGTNENQVPPDEYQVYLDIMAHCERIVKGLDHPLRVTLEQLLENAFTYGHGIAEIVKEYRMDGGTKQTNDQQKVTSPPLAPKYPKASIWERIGLVKSDVQPDPATITRPTLKNEQLRLMPKCIKVKPRGTVRFVIDAYFNVLGMAPYRRGYFNSGINWNEIIDREKFAVLTMNRKDEDPRGKSSLRPAVNWYNIKSQFPAEVLRFILEESVPKAVGTLAEGAAPYEYERDQKTGAIINDPATGQPKSLTAVESFARSITNFRSGSGAIIPFGAKLEPFKKGINTDAALFPIMMKLINDEIENAILLQTLAQSEGAHQAKSASQQVAELLHNLTFWVKYNLSMMILYDIFEPSVRENYGDWAVMYLPQVSLGDFVRRDWKDDLDALSTAYFQGFLDDTQRPELMQWMSLPKPGPSRQELLGQAPAKQDVNGQPVPQPNTRPDKNAGSGRNRGNGTEKKKNEISGFGFTGPLGNNSRWFRRS